MSNDDEDKKTILLIDDEVDLAEMTAFQLKSHGYDVVIAHNGVEGLEKIENIEPDLIILDINMPKMGGIEFYENILDCEDKPRFPILVLTARANLEQLFSQLMVEGFMTKPFELDQLVEEVDIIVNKKEEFGAGIGGEGSSKKVMIIEDEQEMFNKISVAFLDDGHTVIGARNGSEAFQKIRKDLPDLVIAKMTLPDLGGDEVISKLKRMPRLKQIKFILYFPKGEADDTPVAEKISQKAGAHLYVDSNEPHLLLKEAKGLFPSSRKGA